jgi:hypothetical protein
MSTRSGERTGVAPVSLRTRIDHIHLREGAIRGEHDVPERTLGHAAVGGGSVAADVRRQDG